MKKTIAFIVLFFVAASLFSAYYYWSNSSISTSGQTSTMGVLIEKTSDIINCGISSTFDSSKSDLGLTDVSTKSFDSITDTSSQEWSYKGKIDELYVWWQIYSKTKYQINMRVSPLKDNGTGNIVIPYSITIYNLGSNSSYVEEDSTTFKDVSSTVVSKTIMETSGSDSIETGHRKLSLTTNDVKGIAYSESFEATLTIEVVSV
ncbi:MAG: hypothetical protein SPF69_09565 [Candidatus Ornithospirochaeta sp.]|nr:hypothetical protein [Sphaerochaetaceae bacterium]MDY5524308.1 hypothetical protein [Candidatus Ornithospirochaeta sp.]